MTCHSAELTVGSVSIYDSALVEIGDRVLIGPDCNICTDTHEVDSADRQKSNSGSFAKPIKIGADCWFGTGVRVLPGVTIGRGCTIAAGVSKL
jgi:acetyltransferase-like isoleucine patch superfamily enzyme